ncbi:MAG TPA: hypothetical protein VGU01_07730 [Sphingomicrobium sp.]|nr:hypothetical protein [Sphingomicrobium sp.]
MIITVEREAAQAKSRLVHLSLLGLNLRLMENWRSVQIGMMGSVLDYETTMILMAIIVISAEKLLRTELDPELQTLTQRLPRNKTSKVNLSSIASATAINRETVRRKVNDLQKAGLIIRDEDGIRIPEGIVDLDLLRQIIDAQLEAITRTVNQLSKLGVLLRAGAESVATEGSSAAPLR